MACVRPRLRSPFLPVAATLALHAGVVATGDPLWQPGDPIACPIGSVTALTTFQDDLIAAGSLALVQGSSVNRSAHFNTTTEVDALAVRGTGLGLTIGRM